MTLIDLYVAEVGKRLPLRSRSDIEAELRSTLQDMLEDRSRRAGQPVDDAMVKDLLKEYGPPDKVAATYHPTQYLIGPRMFPFFRFVLRIVLTVLTVVLLVGLAIQIASQPLQGMELAKGIGTGLAGILGAAIQAFGNIALVFAILERVMPASEFKFDEEKKEWDPASLVKAETKAEVKLGETIATVVFTVAAMILFNGYPQLIGISFLKNGQWTSIPALTAAFFRWLPYINVLWALRIALNLVLLRQGRWQTATKWSSLALRVAGMVIGIILYAGPAIVSLSPATLQSTGVFDAGSAARLSQLIPQLARAVLVLVVILQGVDVVKEGMQLMRRR